MSAAAAHPWGGPRDPRMPAATRRSGAGPAFASPTETAQAPEFGHSGRHPRRPRGLRCGGKHVGHVRPHFLVNVSGKAPKRGRPNVLAATGKTMCLRPPAASYAGGRAATIFATAAPRRTICGSPPISLGWERPTDARPLRRRSMSASHSVRARRRPRSPSSLRISSRANGVMKREPSVAVSAGSRAVLSIRSS